MMTAETIESQLRNLVDLKRSESQSYIRQVINSFADDLSRLLVPVAPEYKTSSRSRSTEQIPAEAFGAERVFEVISLLRKGDAEQALLRWQHKSDDPSDSPP